jgi:hypothetical protein
MVSGCHLRDSATGHLVPLKHPYTAQSVAQLYVDHIYKLHGMPKILISDRDKVFTSVF